MSTLTVPPGSLIVKDPSDVRVVEFDWDKSLDDTASIASSSFTVTTIRPSGDTALTITDSGTGLGIQSGNRQTKVKLTAGTLGAVYEVANAIVTDETPAQTKERSIRVLIQNL